MTMLEKLKVLQTEWQIRKASRLLASLTPVETLEFMMNPHTGLGLEDCDSLVALAFGNCPEGEKASVIRRISENYLRAQWMKKDEPEYLTELRKQASRD